MVWDTEKQIWWVPCSSSLSSQPRSTCPRDLPHPVQLPASQSLLVQEAGWKFGGEGALMPRKQLLSQWWMWVAGDMLQLPRCWSSERDLWGVAPLRLLVPHQGRSPVPRVITLNNTLFQLPPRPCLNSLPHYQCLLDACPRQVTGT